MQTYPKIPGQSARKRLIYVGECPDRIGFKVLDPVTMVFSSEFELLFNENSCSERMNRLMEHDARRSLAQAGKLHELPTVDEANAGRLTLEQECCEQTVRNIFHSPHASERERKAESSLPTVDDESVKIKSAKAPRAAGGPGACSDKTDRVIENDSLRPRAVHPVDANPLTKGGELPNAELTAGNKSEVVASERCEKSTSKRATKVAGVKHMGIDVDISEPAERNVATQGGDLRDGRIGETRNAAGSDDGRHVDVDHHDVRTSSQRRAEHQAVDHHDVRTSSRDRRAEHQAVVGPRENRNEPVLTRLTTGELGSGSSTSPAECGDNGKPNEALGGTPPVPSQRVVLLPDDSVISPVMLEHSTEARALQWNGRSKGVTCTPLSLDQILQAECEDEEASPSEKAVQFGPLAPDAIREELAKHQFDAQRPMRPVRIKPIGAVEEDTEAFKAFRHAAFEGDFPIRIAMWSKGSHWRPDPCAFENSKRVNSKSYDRWRKYSCLVGSWICVRRVGIKLKERGRLVVRSKIS